MATLKIRDVPDDLYARLRERAERERRSLAQEVIVAIARDLQRGGEDVRAQRRALLAEAAAQPIALPKVLPDPAALVREDRER